MNKKELDVGSIRRCIKDCSAAVAGLAGQAAAIRDISGTIVKALKSGGKVLTAGNGGSAADALHMAEEFIGRYRSNRRSLPAVSLTADTTALTCIANDFGYDAVFSRQIEGLGRPGDVFVIFSTSGKSANLLTALDAARARKMKVICLLGKGGGSLAGKGDHEVIVKSDRTERVQEVHQLVIHLILEAVETAYAGPSV